MIERWRPADERSELLDQRLEWHPVGAPASLAIGLPPLFAEICGSHHG